MMRKLFERMAQARKELKSMDIKKVEYVQRAYDDYVTEAAKMDDDLKFVGNPEQCKTDWMIGAVMSELMNGVEFNRIFALLDVLAVGSSMSVC